jgi:asparagine synthase (glutamine-hydrolysing)
MCGIVGVIDLRGRPIATEPLAAARDALAHRGPDDRGVWHERVEGFSVALAHTRLAVLDLSPAGHQPFGDPTGRRQIVFNGEIYNFLDLRKDLSAGYAFETRCDTETLLAAMIRWGPEGLTRLNGMWAFAFVDMEQRRGWLARDRFGVKPLYYAIEAGAGVSVPPALQEAGDPALTGCGGTPAARLAFASEMRALLPLLGGWGGAPAIDREALYLYLSLGFIPHPWTIFRGVYKLPPGHVLEFDAAGVRPARRYYRVVPAQGPTPEYSEAQVELRHRIAAAVDARRIADVPLGAFLSGGLDSAVVVAELARASGSSGSSSAGGGRVKTFSIGYADQPAYDETRYARLVADRFGTDHHEFKLTFDDVLAAIPSLVEHAAEPFADSSLIPTSLVSRYTRQHVTVALSGDGGDELFGGYWRYLGHHYLQRYRSLPRPIRRWIMEPLLAAAPSAKSGRWLNRVRQARKLLRGDHTDPFERHAAWSRFAERETVDRLLTGPERVDVAVCLRRARQDIAPDMIADDDLTSLMLADLGFSLPADMLAKVDTASMLYALEVRVPMLDPSVVEYVASLPVQYKIDPTQRDGQKRILRDAYRDVLPAEVLLRKKMGFEVPIGEFLRGPLRDTYCDAVRADVLGDLGIDPRTAEMLWQDHQARRHERADILYALFCLCRWYRTWVVSSR